MASGSPDGSTGASAETPIEQRVRLLVGQLQDQSAPSGIRYCRSEPVLHDNLSQFRAVLDNALSAPITGRLITRL